MTLSELLLVTNESQTIRLQVKHPNIYEEVSQAETNYCGFIADIKDTIKKFLNCKVLEVKTEKEILVITIAYNNYIPFTLNESNIEEYSDAFYKYE
jgi:hypothetical protein